MTTTQQVLTAATINRDNARNAMNSHKVGSPAWRLAEENLNFWQGKVAAEEHTLELEKSTLHLQGIGRVHAKPAAELQVGDRIRWNYGYTSVIEGIARISPKFQRFVLKDEKSGHVSIRRMKDERLVGLA